MEGYLTGGPPRQLVDHGQSKPHGPQPARPRPSNTTNTIADARRTIRNPSLGVVYTGILRKSRTDCLIAGHSGRSAPSRELKGVPETLA